MNVDAIEARALEIPFKASFRHASAERAAMQSVWIDARGEGHRGCGEGCPREYVTGETLHGALAFCAAHAPALCEAVGDLPSLREWMRDHRDAVERNPAAWCAVELALLDLLARRDGASVERLLDVPELTGRFRYTAVLGDAAPAAFEAQLARYVQAGFRDFKVKLSGDAARDRAKVGALCAAGIEPAAVRADANNLWREAADAIDALRALDYPFHALEEPLAAGDYDGMRRISDAVGARMILDESVVRAGQLDALSDAQRWIVNLRVSKMGGVLRSLDLASDVRRRGLQVIVGAHVGETSVLTRAALTVAGACRDVLVAQEGAVGTHLLAHDVAEPPLMFGAGGVLEVAAAGLTPAGWGLAITR